MSDPEYPNFHDFIKMMHIVSTDARRNFIFSWPLNIVLRSKHQEITVIIILINGNNSDVSETRWKVGCSIFSIFFLWEINCYFFFCHSYFCKFSISFLSVIIFPLAISPFVHPFHLTSEHHEKLNFKFIDLILMTHQDMLLLGKVQSKMLSFFFNFKIHPVDVKKEKPFLCSLLNCG